MLKTKPNWTHVYRNFFGRFDPRQMSDVFGLFKLSQAVYYG